MSITIIMLIVVMVFEMKKEVNNSRSRYLQERVSYCTAGNCHQEKHSLITPGQCMW